MSIHISRKDFERYVKKALADIPRTYRNLFHNIQIVVQDKPDEEDAYNAGVPSDSLLGLFKGVAFSQEKMFFALPQPMPNIIYLYQDNIESGCSNEQDLMREIRMTLLHEVGHYLGLTEEDLSDFENGEFP